MRDGRNGGHFEVLVVEDDVSCLSEYCELLEGLGYQCLRASDGKSALKLLSENIDIGVVLTDIGMPSLDGLTLLGEIQSRFSPFRPLVPIVVTGMSDLDTAVEAMRADAIDYLTKPVSLAEVAATMRRAANRWTYIQNQFRLISTLENMPKAIDEPRKNESAVDFSHPNDRESLKRLIRSAVKIRQRRSEFMDASRFADPSWDIVLDLTSAALEGRSVPVLGATAATNAPVTTALRHVDKLVEAGIVKRWNDPTDKRRSLLSLEDEALEQMLRYLASAWTSLSGEVFNKVR